MRQSLSIIPSLQRSDIILALFVVAITAMLLIPLPTFLLDFLLVINISFSLLLLLVGLYMPNALALLTFPSLLLLTTLFRLSLNVASTRLILSQGDAGRVIQAFGTFLISGEIVVGVLIFIIITVVNFIVVARGSSRVSEVAARFSLDALPGKQMAINSDMRAGILSPQEAEMKREDLRRESQLYGSMDGAMKFVQGDVIAGFFIIIANIVGGLYIGISNGLSFADAIQTYTILTVGDGLVSQIPALLISICAGIVVTRVSSSDQATLGADVGAQVFQRSGTVMFAGLLLLLIACFPGLPVFPFVVVGLFFIIGAYLLHRSKKTVSPSSLALFETPSLTIGEKRLLPAAGMVSDPQLRIALDAELLFRLYDANREYYQQWWNGFRSEYHQAIGLSLPEPLIVRNDTLKSMHYSVAIAGTLVKDGELLLDSVLVEINPNMASIMGLEVLQVTRHPLNGATVFWALDSPKLRKVIEFAELRVFDFMQYIFLEIACFYQKHPEELLSISEVYARVKDLERKHPGLISEAFHSNFISTSKLTETLQALVKEGVNIRDFKMIIESIASYCSAYGLTAEQDSDFDLHDIVSHIRVQKKRQVVSSLLSDRRTLKVLTLSKEVEEVLCEAPLNTYNSSLSVDIDLFESLRSSFDTVLEPVVSRGFLPVSVLCHSDIRHKIASFISASNLATKVVTYEELDPLIDIEPVGVWAL